MPKKNQFRVKTFASLITLLSQVNTEFRMIFVFPDYARKRYVTTKCYITNKNGDNAITGVYISEIH